MERGENGVGRGEGKSCVFFLSFYDVCTSGTFIFVFVIL